jgi:hypothetical protein
VPVRDEVVREHVLQEMREEIRNLAGERGMSYEEIEQHVNGHRQLTETEQELVYLLTYHAVAEARGRY